jgi:Cu(I)/Ag(I) efflux system membrane protein CusA/SilA
MLEGHERYGVNVRFLQDLRDSPQAIADNVMLPMPSGAMIPLGQVATVNIAMDPPSIQTEDAQPVTYIYIDLQGRDLGGYVADASRWGAQQIKMPPGYHLEWSGLPLSG